MIKVMLFLKKSLNKKKIIQMKNFLMLVLGLISQMVLFAQTPPDPGDNALGGSDEDLPVNQYTVLLVVILLGVAIWYYKKNVTKLVK